MRANFKKAFQSPEEEYSSASWLSVVRVLYAAYFLVLMPLQSASSVADLDDSWINAPLGPFMFMDAAPSKTVISLLESGLSLGLFALMIGYRTSFVSYSTSTILLVLGGIRYSTGKIDHDILLYLVPIFLARSWGSRLSVRPERYVLPRIDILSVVVGFFFLTSGLQKLLSGWLDFESSATLDWLHFYRVNYGVETYWASIGSSWPQSVWETIDWATVFFECSVLPLLMFRRTIPLGIVLCLTFNVAVFLLFGINFAKLVLVYLAILPIRMKVPERIGHLPGFAMITLVLVAATSIIANGGNVVVGPFSSQVSAFWIVVVTTLIVVLAKTHISLRRERGLIAKPLVATTTLLVLTLPFAISLFYTEPYPAVIGPGFRAGVSGEMRQVFKLKGKEVTAADIFGTTPFAGNIAFYGWPSPEGQTHEYRPWVGNNIPQLPEGAEIEWLPTK